MGNKGQITARIQEQQIMSLLEKAGEKQPTTKVTILHRKNFDSDSDPDDSDLLWLDVLLF